MKTSALAFAGIVAGCLVAWAACPALAQAVDRDDAVSFEQQWIQSARPELPRRARLQYRQTIHATMSDGAFAQLSSSIQGRPDHPDRLRVEIEARRRERPDVVDIDIWSDGSSRWRFGRTDHSQGFWADVVLDGGIAWSHTAGSLTIIDASDPPPGRDLASTGAEIEGALRAIVLGDLGAPGVVLEAGEAASSESTPAAVFVAQYPSGLRREILARRSHPGGRWLTESWRTVASSRADTIGHQRRFEGWQFSEILGDWIASRVETRSGDGRLIETLELVAVSSPTDAELADVLRPPPAGGQDSLRGATTFGSVFDFRPSTPIVTTIEPGGSVSSRTLPGTSATAAAAWRLVGWIVAGLLGAALIGVRVLSARRRRRVAGVH